MLTVTYRGDYNKTEAFLKGLINIKFIKMQILRKYGEKGVRALQKATPVDTGLTAISWDYDIQLGPVVDKIIFTNSNSNKGIHIAMILQYGHGTGTGGWVEGRDYINPAIQSVFDDMVEEVWKEVTKL